MRSMSKAKNPYRDPSDWAAGREYGYAEGLRDGAKRERRALRQWLNAPASRKAVDHEMTISGWLTARGKKEKE